MSLEPERTRFYRLSQHEKEKVLEKIRELLASHDEIVLAIVYGSFLGDKSFRDIDIAVYVKGDIDVLGYELKLEEELSKQIGFPIDVRVVNEAPPWFTRKVLEKGKIIVSREPFIAEKLYLKALDEETLTRQARSRA